jgi:magnesium-transporting ATPase (P-type)
MESVKQEAKNILWLLIGVTAIFSGLCGLLFVDNERLKKLLEAASIIAVGIIIMFTTSVADYLKDTQFVRLQSLVKNEHITVIRGKYNATHRVSVWKLVVGDVILLETGMRVPADCIVIKSVDLKVDEKPEDDDVQQTLKGPRE